MPSNLFVNSEFHPIIILFYYQIKYGAYMSMSIPLFSGFELDGLWPTSILIFLIQVSRHDTAHWSLAGDSYINKPCLISSFYLTSFFFCRGFLQISDFRMSNLKLLPMKPSCLLVKSPLFYGEIKSTSFLLGGLEQLLFFNWECHHPN